MSTVKANNVQVGQNATATNNFTWYQPTTPDGTVRLGVGNAGATSADVMTANSSGNVGIGTSSPGYKLALESSSNFAIHLLKTGSNDGWVRNIGTMDIAAASGGGSGQAITFSTGANFAGLTERMRIDGTGKVLMPFQPAFHATRDTAFNAGSGVIVFPTTVTNISSGYNNSTGRFTAPVAGTYLIMTSFFTNIANAPIDFRICVNGGTVGGNATTGTTSVTRDCHAYMVYTLAVNDYVTIEAAGFGTNIPAGLGVFQTFSGHLIG